MDLGEDLRQDVVGDRAAHPLGERGGLQLVDGEQREHAHRRQRRDIPSCWRYPATTWMRRRFSRVDGVDRAGHHQVVAQDDRVPVVLSGPGADEGAPVGERGKNIARTRW